MIENSQTARVVPGVAAAVDAKAGKCRCFVSYTGVKRPFKTVDPLEEADLSNRNTFIKPSFDAINRLIGFAGERTAENAVRRAQCAGVSCPATT
ncbi:MAG: DUF6156 family protein [Beijerinckiaceae bacterium]